MKIALISDLHFGVMKNNMDICKEQKHYISNVFIPYLKENNIDTIFFLGDTFHDREILNIKIKNEVYDIYKNKLKDFDVKILIGNHDIYYKTTTEVHSLKFVEELKNVEIINDIKSYEIGGRSILTIPWQTNDEFLNQEYDDHDICLGHFEITNCKMSNDYECTEGVDDGYFFNMFDLTFSGHFHVFSERTYNGKKIVYIGSPWHLNRGDSGTDRGFVIVDLDKMNYKRVINNTSPKFIKNKFPNKLKPEEITNNIVDIYVELDDIKTEKEFDEYITYINEHNPIKTNVFPSYSYINYEYTDVDIESFKSIDEVIDEYIDKNFDVKKSVKNKVKDCITNKLKDLENI